jgi:hypothetical protein
MVYRIACVYLVLYLLLYVVSCTTLHVDYAERCEVIEYAFGGYAFYVKIDCSRAIGISMAEEEAVIADLESDAAEEEFKETVLDAAKDKLLNDEETAKGLPQKTDAEKGFKGEAEHHF